MDPAGSPRQFLPGSRCCGASVSERPPVWPFEAAWTPGPGGSQVLETTERGADQPEALAVPRGTGTRPGEPVPTGPLIRATSRPRRRPLCGRRLAVERATGVSAELSEDPSPACDARFGRTPAGLLTSVHPPADEATPVTLAPHGSSGPGSGSAAGP